MNARWKSLAIGFGATLAVPGCLTPDQSTAVVPPVPPGHVASAPSPFPARSAYPPQNLELAARVDGLGRKLLAANPQVGLQHVVFSTIGDPRPEIFHRGQVEIIVTEGLVQQCRDEAELAAVLCLELGKMVSEREAQAKPRTRLPRREEVIDVRVGNEVGGSFGPADGTALAELGKLQQERQRVVEAASLPPDPRVVAGGLLQRAGFAQEDLQRIEPILRLVEKNNTFEKQMKPSEPPRDR
jgi:hypothetical protein